MSNLLSGYMYQVPGPAISEIWYGSASQTITVDEECFAMVYLIGGGGSGAKSIGNTAGVSYLATGGNAGGLVVKLVRLKPGVNYVFTAGAGGAARASTTNVQDGLAGSNSTLVSSDSLISMTAFGGKGGNGTTKTDSGTWNPNPLASGTGGDAAYNGGRGGSIVYIDPVSATVYAATGGGAVNLRGVVGEAPCSGGVITMDTAGNGDRFATGGGGVGGRGGNITGNSGSSINSATGGGGSGGNGAGIVDANGTQATTGGAAFAGDFGFGEYSQPRGVGDDGQVGTTPSGHGQGGGGGGAVVAGGGIDAGSGGRFSGGGGLANVDSTIDAGSGKGIAGGGGGGMVGGSADAGNVTGSGGAGALIIRKFSIARNIR